MLDNFLDTQQKIHGSNESGSCWPRSKWQQKKKERKISSTSFRLIWIMIYPRSNLIPFNSPAPIRILYLWTIGAVVKSLEFRCVMFLAHQDRRRRFDVGGKKESVSKHHLATASTTLASTNGRSRSDSLTREANDKKWPRWKAAQDLPRLLFMPCRCKNQSFSFSFLFSFFYGVSLKGCVFGRKPAAGRWRVSVRDRERECVSYLQLSYHSQPKEGGRERDNTHTHTHNRSPDTQLQLPQDLCILPSPLFSIYP